MAEGERVEGKERGEWWGRRSGSECSRPAPPHAPTASPAAHSAAHPLPAAHPAAAHTDAAAHPLGAGLLGAGLGLGLGLGHGAGPASRLRRGCPGTSPAAPPLALHCCASRPSWTRRGLACAV